MIKLNSAGANRRSHSLRHKQVAFRLAEVAAKIPLECDRLEFLYSLLQRNLLVIVPEEAGVVKAGAQDSLVAVADDGHSLGIDFGIQHRQEMGRQCMLLIFEREVFLMITHHGDQNFFGQSQVLGLKVAKDNSRPLCKVGDLLHQFFVLTPVSAGERAGGSVEGFADALAADGGIGHNKGSLERRKIAGGTGYGNWPLTIEHAMSIADIAGADAGKLQRNDGFVQQT